VDSYARAVETLVEKVAAPEGDLELEGSTIEVLYKKKNEKAHTARCRGSNVQYPQTIVCCLRIHNRRYLLRVIGTKYADRQS
jgi:hypothetical protein